MVIETANGTSSNAEITGFRAGVSFASLLQRTANIAPGDRAYIRSAASQIRVGADLLGRVCGPLGELLDGLPPPYLEDHWPLNGVSENVLRRGRVTVPMQTGLRALDALMPIGYGQRVAIMAGSGVGKSVLLGQIVGGCDVDVIVVGLIGERAREVSDFVETGLDTARRSRTVIVAVSADNAPLLRIRAMMRTAAMAEYFRAKGLRVLLLIDSLTRVAHAQREIGLAMHEPPTMKGYPPSAVALIPQIIERAGVDRVSGGSITAFYTVLADGDDMDDPIVDAARAIADGHILLRRSLANAGIYPAIDIAASLSRIAPQLMGLEQAAAARNFRALWSHWQDNRDLALMGAYQPGGDPQVDLAMARQSDLTRFLMQSPDVVAERDAAIATLIREFSA